MRTKLIIICAVLLSALLYFRSIPPLYASDFDEFAKNLIRTYGATQESAVTDAVLDYLDENEVQNPIAFFEENLGNMYIIDPQDPDLTPNDISRVNSDGFSRYTGFSRRYFKRPFSHYQLRVQIRDYPSGERIIKARIYYRGLVF